MTPGRDVPTNIKYGHLQRQLRQSSTSGLGKSSTTTLVTQSYKHLKSSHVLWLLNDTVTIKVLIPHPGIQVKIETFRVLDNDGTIRHSHVTVGLFLLKDGQNFIYSVVGSEHNPTGNDTKMSSTKSWRIFREKSTLTPNGRPSYRTVVSTPRGSSAGYCAAEVKEIHYSTLSHSFSTCLVYLSHSYRIGHSQRYLFGQTFVQEG